MKNKKRVQIGFVVVDSGQIMITDPCYLKSDWQTNTGRGQINIKSKEYLGEYSYEGCCSTSLNTEGGCGQLDFKKLGGAGVVVSNFGGDGVYPVYADFENNYVVKVYVEFQ